MESPQDLANEKLKLEIELLKNKVKAESHAAPRGKFSRFIFYLKKYAKNWGTITIGILSFITVTWTYFDTIRSHFKQIYQQQEITWSSDQSKLMDSLVSKDNWVRNKAAVMLARYDINVLDYLILQLKVKSIDKDITDETEYFRQIKNNIFFTVKKLKENNSRKKFNDYIFHIIDNYKTQDSTDIRLDKQHDNFCMAIADLYYSVYDKNDAGDYINNLISMRNTYNKYISADEDYRKKAVDSYYEKIIQKMKLSNAGN